MDYRKTAERMKCNALDWKIDSQYRKDFNDSYSAITDLLARTEAAETKLSDAQEALENQKKQLSEYRENVRSNYKRLREEIEKQKRLCEEATRRAEAEGAAQETLQKAMAEYKDRAGSRVES